MHALKCAPHATYKPGKLKAKRQVLWVKFADYMRIGGTASAMTESPNSIKHLPFPPLNWARPLSSRAGSEVEGQLAGPSKSRLSDNAGGEFNPARGAVELLSSGVVG